MYCATPPGAGWDACGLAQWPSSGGSYYQDPYSSPYLPGGGVTLPYLPGQLPGDYALESSWYDPIIDIAGEVGSDLLKLIKEWLTERLSREAWEALPEEGKREFVSRAVRDITGSAGLGAALPWIVAGGLALLLVGRRR